MFRERKILLSIDVKLVNQNTREFNLNRWRENRIKNDEKRRKDGRKIFRKFREDLVAFRGKRGCSSRPATPRPRREIRENAFPCLADV